MEGGRIYWYYDTLTPRMLAFPVEFDIALGRVLEELARQVEEYAQANAPWEDRTGDARRGLTAEVEDDVLNHAIVLYHTVDYGIWLEVRWSGKYAIIVPTIEVMGPRIMAQLELVMELIP
jgi:hypothetical protein